MVPVLVMDEQLRAPVVAAFVPHDNVPVQVSEPVDAVPLLLIDEQGYCTHCGGVSATR